MEAKAPSASRVSLTVLMGPSQANTMGNVHGGYVMMLCDEAGGMAAVKHARRPAVTIAVDSMTFYSPVHIGNLLTVEAHVTWTGRSSLETRVVVSAENPMTGEVTHTNTAYFVYVALDDDGRPTPVPPLQLETEAQKQHFANAEARQAHRLQQRHRESA